VPAEKRGAQPADETGGRANLIRFARPSFFYGFENRLQQPALLRRRAFQLLKRAADQLRMDAGRPHRQIPPALFGGGIMDNHMDRSALPADSAHLLPVLQCMRGGPPACGTAKKRAKFMLFTPPCCVVYCFQWKGFFRRGQGPHPPCARRAALHLPAARFSASAGGRPAGCTRCKRPPFFARNP